MVLLYFDLVFYVFELGRELVSKCVVQIGQVANILFLLKTLFFELSERERMHKLDNKSLYILPSIWSTVSSSDKILFNLTSSLSLANCFVVLLNVLLLYKIHTFLSSEFRVYGPYTVVYSSYKLKT